MGNKFDFMSGDHQVCIDQFVLATHAVAAKNWPDAQAAFRTFRENITKHFHQEEILLFPALSISGGKKDIVQVMKIEHSQIRSLIDVMTTLIACKDGMSYKRLADRLLILMKQHNQQEEQILYPIAERLFNNERDNFHLFMQFS